MTTPGSASKVSERLRVDPIKIRWVNQLIRQGEGSNIEFKAKTNFPDKIVRELIAFANTSGGILLVGVTDDGKISGVKYPEEDLILIQKALAKYCWPRLKFKATLIKVSEKKWVVAFEIRESKRKPIRFQETRRKTLTYIRYKDQTLQATPEAIEILRLRSSNRSNWFTYEEVENKLLKILSSGGKLTFNELKNLTGINPSTLSSKLISVAGTNVIGWEPKDGYDLYYSK